MREHHVGHVSPFGVADARSHEGIVDILISPKANENFTQCWLPQQRNPKFSE
jgi:hypothetical protein